MNPDLYLINSPIDLPKLGSRPATRHVFDEPAAYALAAAEAANRPLLVRGEPGTGKSQLARAAAVARGKLFLSVVVHAHTESQDLQWHYDAVARLGEAQTLAHVEVGDRLDRMHPHRFLSPGPLWWVFDWDSAQAQWNACANPPEPVPPRAQAWRPSHGCVVLIDEIDKADTDLPNGLLETLGNGDFTIPYTGTAVRQSDESPPPLVVITTNEERELPPAFVRRCLVLPLSLPEEDHALIDLLCLEAYGDAHLERLAAALGYDCLELSPPPAPLPVPASGHPPSPEREISTISGKRPQARFCRVIELRRLTPAEVVRDEPAWFRQAQPMQEEIRADAAARPPTWVPLMRWSRLWPFLKQVLGAQLELAALDVPRIVERVARGELLEELPRKRRAGWAGACQVIIDYAEPLLPFWSGFNDVRRRLTGLRGVQGLTIVAFPDGEPDGRCWQWVEAKQTWQAMAGYRVPAAGTPVLVLSDLGCIDTAEARRRQWQRLGLRLQRAGCRPVAFMPCLPHAGGRRR
jgi:MoxR-like ATPase